MCVSEGSCVDMELCYWYVGHGGVDAVYPVGFETLVYVGVEALSPTRVGEAQHTLFVCPLIR